jgi:hypothetical protein
MTATALLHAHGVQVIRSDDGQMKLSGLAALSPDRARKIVEHARANKAEILAETMAEEEHPAERYAQGCPKYWAHCLQCPDARLGSLFFCRKLRAEDGRWTA